MIDEPTAASKGSKVADNPGCHERLPSKIVENPLVAPTLPLFDSIERMLSLATCVCLPTASENRRGRAMLAKEMKSGTVVVDNDVPLIIESVTVQSPSARGAATLYKFRARNLISKQKVDLTLKGTDNLPEADFRKRLVKMMYKDAESVHLMDDEDYNQYTIGVEEAAEQLQYFTEELEGTYALIYQDECVGLQLPTTVELDIAQCDPAIRGNSATSRTKPATLSTGLVVQVPEYIKEGERIKVDTRTGDFISRA